MAYWVLKAALTPLLRLGYRLRVTGREHVPRRGPVILAANHRSFLDSVFLPLVVPRRVTFVAKAEYLDDPKTAWFFRACGQIRSAAAAATRASAPWHPRSRCSRGATPSRSIPRAPARVTASSIAGTREWR